MADELRVNGNLYGWGSIVAKVDGERFYGIASINYGDKLERAKSYGMGRHHAPRGRTPGKYSTEPVAVKMEKKTAQEMRATLAKKSASGTSYGAVEFEIVVQFIEGTDVQTDVLERCTWAGDASKNEESPDPLYDEVELDCMLIRRNGLVLFDDSQGSP